jgi:hypothetical protein
MRSRPSAASREPRTVWRPFSYRPEGTSHRAPEHRRSPREGHALAENTPHVRNPRTPNARDGPLLLATIPAPKVSNSRAPLRDARQGHSSRVTFRKWPRPSHCCLRTHGAGSRRAAAGVRRERRSFGGRALARTKPRPIGRARLGTHASGDGCARDAGARHAAGRRRRRRCWSHVSRSWWRRGQRSGRGRGPGPRGARWIRIDTEQGDRLPTPHDRF